MTCVWAKRTSIFTTFHTFRWLFQLKQSALFTQLHAISRSNESPFHWFFSFSIFNERISFIVWARKNGRIATGTVHNEWDPNGQWTYTFTNCDANNSTVYWFIIIIFLLACDLFEFCDWRYYCRGLTNNFEKSNDITKWYIDANSMLAWIEYDGKILTTSTQWTIVRRTQ